MPMNEIPEALSAALPERYALQRVVGRGGMATVYLAFACRRANEMKNFGVTYVLLLTLVLASPSASEAQVPQCCRWLTHGPL